MGSVYAEITLENAGDAVKGRDGLIKKKEVRSLVVNALVDTGAGTLVINEEISQKLGLQAEGMSEATLADGSKHMFKRMEPVKVHWKNRDSVCMPTMIPSADEVLLGAIPLEDMDLIVDPKEEKLTGRHGDHPVHRV